MPRRSVNAEKVLLESLKNHENQTWSDLLRLTGLSKGALSKHLNVLIDSKIVSTSVDTDRRPPTTRYNLASAPSGILEAFLNMKDYINEETREDFFNILASGNFFKVYAEILAEIFSKPFSLSSFTIPAPKALSRFSEVTGLYIKESMTTNLSDTDILGMNSSEIKDLGENPSLNAATILNPYIMEFVFSIYRFEKALIKSVLPEVNLNTFLLNVQEFKGRMDINGESAFHPLHIHSILCKWNFLYEFNMLLNVWDLSIKKKSENFLYISFSAIYFWIYKIKMTTEVLVDRASERFIT